MDRHGLTRIAYNPPVLVRHAHSCPGSSNVRSIDLSLRQGESFGLNRPISTIYCFDKPSRKAGASPCVVGRPAYRLTRSLLSAGWTSSHCPKAGTLAFGQVSLQYALSPEGAGGHGAAVSLRVRYIAFKPAQQGRRYVLWDTGHALTRARLSSSACQHGGTEVMK